MATWLESLVGTSLLFCVLLVGDVTQLGPVSVDILYSIVQDTSFTSTEHRQVCKH